MTSVGSKRARGEGAWVDGDVACIEAVAPPPTNGTKRATAVWLRACRDMYARIVSSFVREL